MKKNSYLPIVVIVLILIVVFLYIYRGDIYRELGTLKLLPQPELFTELYIDNYSTLAAQLPTTVVKGDNVSFSFTIHNLEACVIFVLGVRHLYYGQ
jgi:hypothetical protein